MFTKPDGVDAGRWRDALRVRWDAVALPEAGTTEEEWMWINRVANDK